VTRNSLNNTLAYTIAPARFKMGKDTAKQKG
jgi:hypothetical protein